MTAIKGTQAKILVDEFDFSGDTAGFTVTVAMSEQDATVLSSTGMEYEPILPSLKIEQNGYVTDLASADEMEGELYERLGVAGAYIAALLGTNVAACPAYLLDSTYGANMQITAPAAGLLTLNGVWGVGRGGDRGIRILSATVSATGAQAAVDLGSAGSDGGAAYLFFQAKVGAVTNASILIESSATEGGAYVTEATFTLNAVDGYKQALTGTVNRWLRVNVSSLGGATSLTMVVIVAVNGVTQ